MKKSFKTKPIQKQKQITTPTVKEEPSVKKKVSNIHQLPTIQNMMEIPIGERPEKVQKYFEQVKPFLAKFMQKKIGSRVLQLMFKWGSDEVKNAMHKCVISNWKDLIHSKFALYIIEKISRDVDLPVVEDAIFLQSTWEGAKILNQCISHNEEKTKLIKQKFYSLWEKSKEEDLKAQESLHNLALKSVQKTFDSLPLSKLIIRLALPTMFAEEKQKVLTHLVQKVSEWVSDQQGVRLFIQLINHCDPKQKKQIVKAFKGHVSEIVGYNNSTYVALIKLLTQVDDTVLIQKSLLPQVEALLPQMNTNKHAFSTIFAIFSPRTHNFNILGKYEHSVRFSQCKKPEDHRKKQLRAYLYSPLLSFLEGDALYQMLKHHINNKLIVGLYKSLQEDNQNDLFNKFISRVANLYLNDAKENLKLKTFENSLCADPNANKIIKGILWLPDEVVDFFCDEFSKLIVKNIDQFLLTKAGFVLLGLVQKGGRDYLLTEIGKQKSKLKDSPVGKHFLSLLGGKRT